MSHMTVTNCLWWGYLTVFIDFLMGGGGRGMLQYIGYMGVCRWKGYDFQAIYSGIGSSNHIKLV